MARHKTVPLFASSLGKYGISNEYFYRMLSPRALQLSAPYHEEESSALETCLRGNVCVKEMNFVAVGGGELWELPRALAYTKSYTCIEPLADVFMSASVKFLVEEADTISYLAKRFEDVTRSDLPDCNNFFMFLFNVISYLDRPVEAINKLSKPGDILFFSTWADTDEARRRRDIYFSYLNSFDDHVMIDPDDVCSLDDFPFAELHCFRKSERFTDRITDILIIYL